jgi:hypothetical protein
LTYAVIGVLADDDNLERRERALVEGTKNVAPGRENLSRGVFGADKIGKLLKIWLIELLL